MRTAAAWSFPCGGCFLWAGGRVAAPSIRCALLAYRWPRPQQLLAASAAGGARRRCSRLRCCSNPPAYVSLTFAQKKTASVSLHQRFFHGRGWTTQAAHLKRPRRGLFAAGTYGGGPYELRLPIFLQPLGGALKNRSAAPASPPCFRRRRRSAPQLFSSTRLCESDFCTKENRQCISTPAVFSWARVDSNHRS